MLIVSPYRGFVVQAGCQDNGFKLSARKTITPLHASVCGGFFIPPDCATQGLDSLCWHTFWPAKYRNGALCPVFVFVVMGVERSLRFDQRHALRVAQDAAPSARRSRATARDDRSPQGEADTIPRSPPNKKTRGPKAPRFFMVPVHFCARCCLTKASTRPLFCR